MKRLLTLLAAVALLLTPFSASLAQTAVDMRLEASTGTVSVTDARGSKLSAQNGMKLFDGYGLNTKSRSYAWFSLDRTKALKLDALSGVNIHKYGRKLKLDLISGKLLCDVSAPLDSEETLEIRTSTTVTGIRGTVLVVKVIDEYTTVIYVLEGSVTVTETNPENGEIRTINVSAGQMAISTARSIPSGGQGNDIALRSFLADEVDGFVLDEIAQNPVFVEHLLSTNSEEVLKLLGQIEPEGDPEPTYVDITITYTDDPAQNMNIPEQFMDALTNNDYLNLTVSGVEDIGLDQDVDIGATQTVNLDNYTIMDMQTHQLNNAGTINVDPTSWLVSDGILINSSSNTLNVYGKLTVRERLENTGIINIYGLAQVLELNNMGTFNIMEGGQLDIHGIGGGGDNAFEPGKLDNTGDINVNGELDIDKANTATNQGDINVSQTGTVNIDNQTVLNNQSEGVITNQGSITRNYTIINDGTIINEGTITGHGTITGDGEVIGNPVGDGES